MSVAARKDRDESGGLGETVKVIVQALLLALVIRTFLFQPFNIPSGSMRPTLLDRRLPVRLEVRLRLFAATRCPFGRRHLFAGRIWAAEPERGDVVVFKLPRDNSDRLHQARDRPARRPHPDERRRALHQRRAGASARSVGEIDDRRRRPRRSRVTARRCRTASATTTLDLDAERLRATTPQVYEVPPGHYLHDGRQSRQLDRQPRALARRRLRAGREPRRPRRDHLLLGRGGQRGLAVLEVAVDASAGTGCSPAVH